MEARNLMGLFKKGKMIKTIINIKKHHPKLYPFLKKIKGD